MQGQFYSKIFWGVSLCQDLLRKRGCRRTLRKCNHLIMADPGFIVYLTDELDICWQTTAEWDEKNPLDPTRHRSLVNKVAELEPAEWDYSDERRTQNYKRQLAEVLSNSFENDYENAEKMLTQVMSYRESILKSREMAIVEQITTADSWNKNSNRWSLVHYAIGVAALLLSTFSAARLQILGLNEAGIQTVAWLVAFFHGSPYVPES